MLNLPGPDAARNLLEPPPASIYSPAFIRALFDEMSATYGIVNLISSFGFSARWRRQCVDAAQLEPGMTVYDLMCGMRECWPAIRRRIGHTGRIVGVDLSANMCQQARDAARRLSPLSVDVVEADALETAFLAESACAVVACFAVKTLASGQQERFARLIAHLLRPGGAYSLLEISVPPASALRVPYLFYLNHIVPQIGRLFLGNPANYRLLGRYTCAFGRCDPLSEYFVRAGLTVVRRDYFFGCATGLVGSKPR